jgi:iron-sulfur cluster assembly accessory protein
MLIGDVLNRLPESAEIMQDFGLHCTSCSVNVFEPLKMGAMSHGIAEEIVDEMIDRINDLALVRKRAPDDGIYVTEFAATKIKEFAKAEDKEGYGLRITAHSSSSTPEKEPAYAMDFTEHGESKDKSFEFHGVEIFLDPESLQNLLGAEVDFIESAYGSGFKISNPNFVGAKKFGCSCGSGGCGGGSCGSDSNDSCGCGDESC